MLKNLIISDVTLDSFHANEKSGVTFREKVEIAKLLDRLLVSVIEFGTPADTTANHLLIKTVAASVKNSVLCVCPGFDKDAILHIWDALKTAKQPRLQIRAAVSTARMEYVYHQKPAAMLQTVKDAVAACRSLCENVEFVAEDATRADRDFLCEMLDTAVTAGASSVTLWDTAGMMLPDEFGAFIADIRNRVPLLQTVTLGVRCSNLLTVANATAIAAIQNGAAEIKVSSLSEDEITLAGIAKLLTAKSADLDAVLPIRTTELKRVLKSMENLCCKKTQEHSPFEDGVRSYSEDISFSKTDGKEDIKKGIHYLGYDLEEADVERVWKAFRDIVQRKASIGIAELEAIIASETMQAPPTYTLENYVVSTGNAIDVTAHVKLKRDDKILDGLSLGDGPIDAAFLAIENITGHHYELDDFQMKAITEGREAMGQAIVKLRSGGKVYSGRGLSTDIIGSGVLAYINALNKILYEEGQV